MHRVFIVTFSAIILTLLLAFAPIAPAFAGGASGHGALPTSPIDTPWSG